jgi:predicted dehydrogenase
MSIPIIQSITPEKTEVGPADQLPEIDLRQLLRLTDDTGMFQHALFAVPDRKHGYCIDDNARALIAALLHAKLRGHDERVVPLQRYLTFLVYAFNERTGTFRNFMAYDRRWLEEEGSHDSQGRTIWALGLAAATAPTEPSRGVAKIVLQRALPGLERLQHLRSWAFALIGLNEYLHHNADDHYATELRDKYAQRLLTAYQDNASQDWPWWEDTVTYDNAKLPHALLVSGNALGRTDMLDTGLAALRWLLQIQTTPQGHLSIIGNHGWYRQGSVKAPFAQQPLEAYAMVHGCLTAAQITGDTSWADHAWQCFEWFRGKNDLGVMLYHEETGGCQDGLEESGPNVNQGAESSLAYLLSVLELHSYYEARAGRITVTGPQTIGYALLGAGRSAELCLQAYRDLPGLKPIAVWSRTAESAQQLASAHGLKAADDLDEILQNTQIHLLHIATPPATHARLAIPALEAGKHVLCEPPPAMDLVELQQMIQAAGRRDRWLGTNLVLRYGPAALALKRILDAGVLGKPLRGIVWNCRSELELPADHWFWNDAESGGPFVAMGVPYFDLLGWLLGAGRAVSAFMLRSPSSTVISHAVCDVVYGEETSVGFYHGFQHQEQVNPEEVRLVCEHGDVRLSGRVPHELTLVALCDQGRVQQSNIILQEASMQCISDDGRPRMHGRTTPPPQPMVWRAQVDPSTDSDTQAMRMLMNDALEAIRHRQHQLAVTLDDAAAALRLALDADRLARGVSR